MRYFFFFLFISYSGIALSQKKYPKGYFRNPLEIPMDLSANFGELRTNHWHMGLDVRTRQRENLRVVAAAEGYVYRISIAPFGFGRALYIRHPNGYTTLYAHLNDFSDRIEAFTRTEQYRRESWAVDIILEPDQLPVKKGEFIAYSGNTGGSMGPHLHFEIRDTETDNCLNPMLFGMPLQDRVPPSIIRLAVYNRTKSLYHQNPITHTLRRSGNTYSLSRYREVVAPDESVSFGIQAYDRLSGSNNPNGIYSAYLYVDGKRSAGFKLDDIDYDQTRFMNAHIDYRRRKMGSGYMQHVSRLPGDEGPVYDATLGDGVIHLKKGERKQIRIEVKDVYGNAVTLKFTLRYDGGERPYEGEDDHIFVPGQVNIADQDEFILHTDLRSVYDKVGVSYSVAQSAAEGAASQRHVLGAEFIPIHDPFNVSIKLNRDVDQDRLLMLNNGKDGDISKAILENGWASAQFDELGSFEVVEDLEPPTINSPGSGDTINMSGERRLIFRPRDNYGIRSFNAWIDGQWLLFTNDKGRTHIYDFDDKWPQGTYQLVVEIVDLAGNTTRESWWTRR